MNRIVKNNRLLFLFFFLLYTPAKLADSLSQSVVMTMGIGKQSGILHVEATGDRIEVLIVGLYVNHLRDEHVMRSKRDNLLHSALNADRALLNQRGLYQFGFSSRQFHLFKLVKISSRSHTTPVGGPCQRLGSELIT